MKTTTLGNLVSMKMDQWTTEAELNFARLARQGVKMHREVWANGMTMVGHEGALPNQFVELSRAVEIYRAGWKV